MEQATAPRFHPADAGAIGERDPRWRGSRIYAIGPWAHLFQGSVEEPTFHVMDFASQISERAKAKTQ